MHVVNTNAVSMLELLVLNEIFHSIPSLDIADVSYYLPHFGQMRLTHVSGEAISFHSLWLKVTTTLGSLHWRSMVRKPS